MFDMTNDTAVTIEGRKRMVRFENGMTGIGSRRFWIDGKEYPYGGVRQSADLTQGNHFLYLFKWRDQPWDKLYVFIHEDHLDGLLDESQAWREPKRVDV